MFDLWIFQAVKLSQLNNINSFTITSASANTEILTLKIFLKLNYKILGENGDYLSIISESGNSKLCKLFQAMNSKRF